MKDVGLLVGYGLVRLGFWGYQVFISVYDAFGRGELGPFGTPTRKEDNGVDGDRL